MSTLARTISISIVFVVIMCCMLFIDVRMQTASAEVLEPGTQGMLLERPVMSIMVPIFETGVDERHTTATFASSSQTHVALSNSATVAPIRNPGAPVRLLIPSINLDVDIRHLGKNAKGEMDVPSGDTNDVGWYKSGTRPGKVGSAVLAAHVFAAFSELKHLSAGSDIYIITDKNERLHFVVEEAKEYALSQVSPQHLFNRRDAVRLNLITCAGQFIPSIDTYDRRLIVYAKLVD